MGGATRLINWLNDRLMNNRLSLLNRRTLIGVVRVCMIGASTVEGTKKSSLGTESSTSTNTTSLMLDHNTTVMYPNGSNVVSQIRRSDMGLVVKLLMAQVRRGTATID